MYINYYELRNFVCKLFDKYIENDIKSIFEMLDSCSFIDIIVDSIVIQCDNNNYNLYFATNYLGTMRSDLEYDINIPKTKMSILKYLIARDHNVFLNFLSGLLNINISKLNNDGNPNLTIFSIMKSRSDEIIDVGNNLCSIECITDNQVYNGSILIGEYSYNGPFYIYKNRDYSNNPVDRTIEVNDKSLVISELYNYNNNYFKCNILNRINISEKITK